MKLAGRIGCGAALGLLGWAVNLAALEVLPGVHLLLGPLMVLAAAVLLGPWAGGVAGAVSGLRTLALWQHPWGWLNISLEGMFVGALRRRLTPLMADLLYWSLSPLYFALTYWFVEDIPVRGVLVSALKQAVNGLLAVLTLQVVLLVPGVRGRLRPLLPPPLAEVSVGRAFGTALTLGAVVPMLVLGGAEGRERYESQLRQMDDGNLHTARLVANEVESSVGHVTHGVNQLARTLTAGLSATGQLPGARYLEGELDALVTYSPEVLSAYVGSPEGIALAFSPRNDLAGQPLAGQDFSDRPYVVRVRHASRPLVSDVQEGRGRLAGTLVVALAPIRNAERYAGYVLASMDLPRLRQYARAQVTDTLQRIRVLDSRGGVVFDSALKEDTSSGQAVIDAALAREQKRVPSGATGTYAAEHDAVTAVRVGTLHHFAVVEVPSLGWRVLVEQPGARLQSEVEHAYFSLLGTMALATACAVALAFAFSRTIVAPVQGVSHAAARQVAGDRAARATEAALNAPRELRQLAETFDQMTGQLARQLEAIERTSREKDAFLSIASHELKTPLTALKAHVQMLRRKLDGAHGERLDNVSRQVDRVTRLVNQMLDASQLGLEQLPLHMSRLDLSEVVRHVAETLVAASPLHTLQLTLEPLVGDFDELRLEQVVHNLVSNAIKYSPTGGLIEVHTRARDGQAELSVADRGLGLRVEDEEQLFGRFKRGDRREVTGISGLGVGLYVSREIIRLHSGRITLRSREGGGAVATVWLPLPPP
ncbi:ATP-binding protein [Archangium primigenium]|uniref:ATP-binding protein n=1 Tax=[Archangium] primigenium TaxID=2792470 RepID=UPI00195D1DC7|nr:ATP-binding protein [Archangium primigenium]MBM7119396.1 histidine kinase [Archangium primigenium]